MIIKWFPTPEKERFIGFRFKFALLCFAVSGLTLTHRGDAVTTADMKSVERKMTNLEFLNEEEIRNFLERIEKEELVEEEEEEDAGAGWERKLLEGTVLGGD